MSEISGDLIASGENNKLEPDFFDFYTSEVANLLSQDESLWPFSHQTSHLPRDLHEVGREKGKIKSSSRTIENNGRCGSAPLFSNGIGALLSEFKSVRLKSLLQQSVFSLTQEVDEMVNPVLSLCRIISCFRYKESLPSLDALACKADQNQLLHKKRRLFLSSSDSESAHVAVPVKKRSDDTVKKCTLCHKTETPQWRSAPDGTKSLCNACGLEAKKNGSILSSNVDTGEENIEIDDDMRTILETDSTMVEELMKKHSCEFLAKLEHMEQKLEELLNNVMTSCRPMTATEKQHLRKLIQNLPPKNLDRVVDIIEPNKPPDQYSSDEMHVDLVDQDKVTLWRLYYYVAANHKRSIDI